MDWFEIVVNGVLFVAVIGGLIFERKWTNRINKRLDGMNVKINSASRAANDAKVNSIDAMRDARNAKSEVKKLTEPESVIVGGKLPDTAANASLVERLREAAHKAQAKRAAKEESARAAHPAGKTHRVPGMRRSAITGRYIPPSTTPPVDNTALNVATFAALASAGSSSYDSGSSSSSYDSGSSSSSSSYDSGSSSSYDSGSSFSGGDSGSF